MTLDPSLLLYTKPQTTQALSTRLKHRIIYYHLNSNLTYEKIADKLGCGYTSVQKFITLYKNTGDVLTDKQFEKKFLKDTRHEDSNCNCLVVLLDLQELLLYQLSIKSTTTLDEYKRLIYNVTELDVSTSSIQRWFHFHNITYKVCCKRATNVNEYDVMSFFEEVHEVMFDFNQIVFFDEIGFTNCTSNRLRGRAPRGLKAIANVHFIRGFKLTWLNACNVNGLYTSMLIEGSCNIDIFEYFMINKLLPTMNPYPMINSILIMDNVPFHHSIRVQEEAIRRGIIIIYTPPYYPNASLSELFGNAIKQKMKQREVHGKQNVIQAILNYPYEITSDWAGVMWKMGYIM